MGCPVWLAEQVKLSRATAHLQAAISVLKAFAFEGCTVPR
jgi:hypothetical protein